MKNLHAAFLASATKHCHQTAVHWGEQEFTYAQVRAQADQISRLLRDTYGIQPGDRVGIWLKNRPEFVSALFGALGVDAVVVPINNFLKGPEVAYQVSDAGIRVLITEQELNLTGNEVRQLCPQLRWLTVEDLPSLDKAAGTSEPSELDAFPASNLNEDDLAVLIYTSGTTGKPKGAMLTHGNLLHNVESCRQVLAVVDFDRFVLMLPMFHSFMLTVCILLPLLVGGSVIVIKSLQQPKNAVMEILQKRGTVLPAMAALFRALAQLPAEITLPLRLCISGAGPLPMEIYKAFTTRHAGVRLIEGYGLSEASPVVSVNPINGDDIPGTIGLPIPNVQMEIRDDNGNPLPDGEVGEICVCGGNVMTGYWNSPEKTQEALVEGWLLTGDVGYRRTDGFYVITERKKDMLKPNGINVYPREIEEVIYRFPGVREAAVVGEPCERRGERPVAFISVDEGIEFSEKALLDFLRLELADYKLPRRAILLASLPRNMTGKILKTELRKLLGRPV
jgi:long-chain acyl-CoA synthetase